MSVNTPPVNYTYDDLCRLIQDVAKQKVPFIRRLVLLAESLKRTTPLDVEFPQELINNVCSNLKTFLHRHMASLDCLTYYRDLVEELADYEARELFKADLEVKNLIAGVYQAMIRSQKYHNDVMRHSLEMYEWETTNPHFPYGLTSALATSYTLPYEQTYGAMRNYRRAMDVRDSYLRLAYSTFKEVRVVCTARENFKRSDRERAEAGLGDDDVFILS